MGKILTNEEIRIVAGVLGELMETISKGKLMLFPGAVGFGQGATLGPGNGEFWATQVYVAQGRARAKVWLNNDGDKAYLPNLHSNVELELRVYRNEKPYLCALWQGEEMKWAIN